MFSMNPRKAFYAPALALPRNAEDKEHETAPKPRGCVWVYSIDNGHSCGRCEHAMRYVYMLKK